MKSLRVVAASTFCVLFAYFTALASKPAGFFLPDSVESMTLTYRMVKDLIVLPVTINDTVNVNLILDTGCRNIVLFGKRFRKIFHISSSRPVQFSGLGEGKPVTGALSLGNKVSIHHVLGKQIPMVIVTNNHAFGSYHGIDGVIGYDIFLKFEIELNPRERTITFRPAQRSSAPSGYTTIPLRIVDARPILDSNVYLDKNNPRKVELMIDTGSSLGLLLKTTNIGEFNNYRSERVLGLGFNGPLSGYEIISRKLELEGFELTRVQTGIVSSKWHNSASIGMEVLKDYIVILNYCKRYVSIRPYDA